MSLTELRLRLTDSQKKKIALAVHNDTSVTIQVLPENYHGNDVLIVTPTIANRAAKHMHQNKGFRLTLSRNLVRKNAKQGGFIQALLPALKVVGPALLSGVLGGVADWGTRKILNKVSPEGKGLFLPGTKGSGKKKEPVIVLDH